MDSKRFIPGVDIYIDQALDQNKPIIRRFSDLFNATINIVEFSLNLFIITTIRTYENKLITEDDEYKKKTKPINDLLKTGFVAPSLGTLAQLAKSCYYLIDDSAPMELIEMKNSLGNLITLGPISDYLNNLNLLFEMLEESDEFAAKTIYKPTSKKNLLTIINDFTKARNESAHLINIITRIEDSHNNLGLNIKAWEEAFKLLVVNLFPIISCDLKYREIDKISTKGGEKTIFINIKTYSKGEISVTNESIKLEDWYEEQWNEKSEILLTYKNGIKKSYNLFPFIILNDDKPYYYKKTRTSGYQYFSFTNDKTFLIKSKKKFNRSIFSSTSSKNSQELFWTKVTPVINPANNVKANIPSQGSGQFIGRKKQIAKIREEIIEIPNQNGILYGPGGVGKTALLIELSNQLYQETKTENILYNNIIWVSAKSNFYNWEQNSTISGSKQFESLKNIMQIILSFFEYEDVDEYLEEELKDLTFGEMEENKILLILDNFETVTKSETSKIINFFGSDVKKRLKHLPNNFKVIITSRELIPSGYYQIKLEGLEARESNMLIKNIYDKYKNSHEPLTQEQCSLLHKATSGIPIVIKHCLGQIFEFQVPLNEILRKLSETSNEVIKFSYSEILSYLKKDECYLKILILLEIIGEPLSLRKISLILDIPLNVINEHIPNLLNFLCLEKMNIGIEEKYRVSSQIGLLAKSLSVDNKKITDDIRKILATNLSLTQRMDYAEAEMEIVQIFNAYKDSGDGYAEFFITEELKNRPNSVLLRYHYAIFLKERKRELKQSIEILKKIDDQISKQGKKDPKILIALINTYLASDVHPDFNSAYSYCQELLKINEKEQFNLFVGEILINWSSFLRTSKEYDPIKDLMRKSKVKEIATEGIILIEKKKPECFQHKYQYLIAQGYANQLNGNKAKEHIKNAINNSGNDLSDLPRYEKFLEFHEKWM